MSTPKKNPAPDATALNSPVEKGPKFWTLNSMGQQKISAVMGRCSSVARGCDLIMLKIVSVDKEYLAHLMKLLSDARADLEFVHDSMGAKP